MTEIFCLCQRNRFRLCLLALVVIAQNVTAMRIVLQRVKSASVSVNQATISSIGRGVVALVGIHELDDEEDLKICCKQLLAAKLWENSDGKPWRHGVKQKDFEVLCVSQFTLYGTLTKKNQPDYKYAMKSEPAQVLYNQFLSMLKDNYSCEKVKDGAFGEMMDVELINDGPVTIVVESGPLALVKPINSSSIEEDGVK